VTLRTAVDGALTAGRPERAWDRAFVAWAGGNRADRHHAGQVLRWLAARLPDAAWIDDRRAQAGRVQAVLSLSPSEPGCVAFPAVGGDASRFVQVTVTLADADDLPLVLDALTADAVRDALAAARRLRATESGLRVHFDAKDWEGPSCGLAVALAAVSALDGVPISPCVAATGAVRPDGRIEDVGADHAKLELRREARPRARLLVPRSWGADEPAIVPVGDLAAAVAAATGTLDDPEPLLQRVRTHDRAGEWIEAARVAEPLLDHPGLDEVERQRLIVLLILAANHGADPDARRRWTARLDPCRLAGRDLEAWARAVGSRVVAHVDALDPVGAREVLDLAPAERLAPDLQVHWRGPAALLATLEGRHADALVLREANVADASADERPRCLGDLADALLRVGRLDEALAAADAGLVLAREHQRRRPYLARTGVYLALHRGRALLALGRTDEALAQVHAAAPLPGPDPRFRLQLLEAEARGSPDLAERAWRSLPAGLMREPLIHLLAWRSLRRLGRPQAAGALPDVAAFRGVSEEEIGGRLPY